MTRYELTERIGAGAMAEIFRGKAVAAGGFEKPVAIKRILPHLSQDERFVELLIAEANIVSHLRHRNIVQVFDVGMGPDGQYFLVMELVDGCNLAAVQEGLEKRGKRMPPGLGLYIGGEVCDALEHAHRAPGPDGSPLRLVHRDVSPNNVLLSRSGEVKLTDFGIAKRTEEVSLHGGVRGKFAYISPEQGSGRSVDARSDVFSVGILLFEMIVGRRLFSGLADFEALKAVCEGNVPRPRSVDSRLDPKLETILLKALAHNPDERYASASDLGKDLRAYRYSLPQASGDPAAELASLVTRIAKNGGAPSKKEAAAPGVRRPGPDDFTGGTNTFTLEEEKSLVRRTTYEEAWQRFRAEEGRVARTYQSARESSEFPSATMLGIPPVVGTTSFRDESDDEDEGDRDMGEEATRVVDPYLRSSRPITRAAPSKEQPAQGAPRLHSVASSEKAAQAGERADAARAGVGGAGGPGSLGAGTGGPGSLGAGAGAGGYGGMSVSARVPAASAAVDGVDGMPPETLELRNSQAHAMVDSVDAAMLAAQSGGQRQGNGHGAASRSAAADAAADSVAPPSGALPRSRAADPISVVRVSSVPGGVAMARKGIPRWAVILFVVLLVSIILAGFFLGGGSTDTGGAGVTAQPGAGAVAAGEPATAANPATGAAATAAAPPTDAGAGDATAAPAGAGAEAGSTARRPRTTEKPTTTRRARPKAKDRQKQRRRRSTD
jgi:serine/threonine protein kinase